MSIAGYRTSVRQAYPPAATYLLPGHFGRRCCDRPQWIPARGRMPATELPRGGEAVTAARWAPLPGCGLLTTLAQAGGVARVRDVYRHPSACRRSDDFRSGAV